jgi:hypothetical protein
MWAIKYSMTPLDIKETVRLRTKFVRSIIREFSTLLKRDVVNPLMFLQTLLDKQKATLKFDKPLPSEIQHDNEQLIDRIKHLLWQRLFRRRATLGDFIKDCPFDIERINETTILIRWNCSSVCDAIKDAFRYWYVKGRHLFHKQLHLKQAAWELSIQKEWYPSILAKLSQKNISYSHPEIVTMVLLHDIKERLADYIEWCNDYSSDGKWEVFLPATTSALLISIFDQTKFTPVNIYTKEGNCVLSISLWDLLCAYGIEMEDVPKNNNKLAAIIQIALICFTALYGFASLIPLAAAAVRAC